MKLPLDLNNISEYQKFVKLINDGIEAEEIMTKYIDTLVTAMNPRDIAKDLEIVNQGTLGPHPCCLDLSLIAQADYPADFSELVNCVQRHVCRLNGYCKKKNKLGSCNTAIANVNPVCRFGYPFQLNDETNIKFTESKSNVRADVVLKRNDPNMNAHIPVVAHGVLTQTHNLLSNHGQPLNTW